RIDLKAARANHTESYQITFCRRVFHPDIAPGLLLRLFGMIRRADVVHINGVYSFTTIPTLALCRLMRKPVAWSTMGALQRWQGTTRTDMKTAWERTCDFFCEPERVVMHVTSEEEKLESLEKIHQAGALVLRNGIEIPPLTRETKMDRAGVLRLLYIGRLHPIKGIENLLRALTLVKSEVTLAICGGGDAEYEANLRTLTSDLDLNQIVFFHGRVDGELREQHFREADLCVAPSFKEAFCTVVLESLARAVPVIASRGIPWQRVEEMGCGLWVGNQPIELAAAIDRASAMPLVGMGQRGRAWMERDFSWPRVASEMIAEYERLIRGKGERELEVMASTKAA
ncbi:MAG: glycosyltransferase family 4 protein, partial [Pyrinomonadaceae bacterium]